MPDCELERLKEARNEVEKLLIFGAWLTKKVKEKGARPPIVVGGSAVEIYSFGHYTSGDIDLVGSREVVKDVLLLSGYFREEGRFFVSDELELFVEVPDDSLAGSYDKIRVIKVPEIEGEVYVIGIEDLIIDRLLACVVWKSEEDCRMTEYLLSKYKDEIDLSYLKNRAQQERVSSKLESILKKEKGKKNARGKGNYPKS